MRLIDADTLMQAIANTATNTVYKAYETGTHTFTEALDRLGELSKEIVGMIAKAPVINPEDFMPHGWWEFNTDNFTPAYRCSACGYQKPVVAGECVSQGAMNYCPHCGAPMDLEGTA